MGKTIELDELLKVAMDAAYAGGRRTLAYFNNGVAVEWKANETPVTQADRESEELIRGLISKQYPTHSILGEEMGETRGDAEYKWIIDPIDGTKTFIHGVPLYGVLIGVEVRGQASVGVIYLPALDEMVSAATGMGCRWNGRIVSVSKVNSLKDSCLLTTSVAACQRRSDAYDNLLSKTKLQRQWGDCYGYVLVATGRAEVQLDPWMNPWDSGPMLPILQEAGGHFVNWKGEPTIYGPDAMACNAGVYEEVLQILKSEKLRV